MWTRWPVRLLFASKTSDPRLKWRHPVADNFTPEQEAHRDAITRVMNSADADFSAREYRTDAGGGDEPGDWFTFLATAVMAVPHPEVTRLTLEAATQRDQLTALLGEIAKLDVDLDSGRADGSIYTYGQVQCRLRALRGGA
jgi:hypothetical protein